MRNSIIAGITVWVMASGVAMFAQSKSDEFVALSERVAQLEQQVQEILKVLEPLKAQQAVAARREALRKRFEQKMARDLEKYTREQLHEAEELYQVANRKWGSPEAAESLRTMIRKYPDINRTGCAVLYIAQRSEGAERVRYLQDCIEEYGGCMYGDGVQVGAYARFLLAQHYRSMGDEEEADALSKEIRTEYADAIDHQGNLLIDSLP